MKKIILTLLLIFWTNISFAETKQLQCNLAMELGQPTNKPIINITYDETAFNSFKPVEATLNDIEFTGERKTLLNEILGVETEVIEAEKMVSNIYHTFDYSVEEKLLVYTFIKKEDANNPSINMYQCE